MFFDIRSARVKDLKFMIRSMFLNFKIVFKISSKCMNELFYNFLKIKLSKKYEITLDLKI